VHAAPERVRSRRLGLDFDAHWLAFLQTLAIIRRGRSEHQSSLRAFRRAVRNGRNPEAVRAVRGRNLQQHLGSGLDVYRRWAELIFFRRHLDDLRALVLRARHARFEAPHRLDPDALEKAGPAKSPMWRIVSAKVEVGNGSNRMELYHTLAHPHFSFIAPAFECGKVSTFRAGQTKRLRLKLARCSGRSDFHGGRAGAPEARLGSGRRLSD
jgi:hypothetical protein